MISVPLGQEALVLRPVDKGDGDRQPVEVGQIDVMAIEIHQMAGVGEKLQVLE